MDPVAAAAIGSAITLIVREFFAGLIQLRGKSSEDDIKKQKEFEERMKGYLAEAKTDLEQARKDKADALAKAEQDARMRVDCEKNVIRLEARIELLTRLYGVKEDDSKVHDALRQIEREVTKKREEGR